VIRGGGGGGNVSGESLCMPLGERGVRTLMVMKRGGEVEKEDEAMDAAGRLLLPPLRTVS
jgi:hypothetical protein